MNSSGDDGACGNFFEDFTVGEIVRHARGRTVTELENVTITTAVMNTAHDHFNTDARQGASFPHILVFGGVSLAIVVGLTTQDTARNAVAELGLDGIRLRRPVTHGDTLYAWTEVVATEPSDDPDAGIVTFRHWGTNQRDELVVEGTRRVLISRSRP